VWQRALARRLAQQTGIELGLVVVQEMPSTANVKWALTNGLRRPAQLLNKVAQRLFFSPVLAEIDRVAHRVFSDGDGGQEWPDVPRCSVRDINGSRAVEVLRNEGADAFLVSGTRMVKDPVFDLCPPRGLFNLHTGLSPYYKGGPNCTLWALARAEPHFLGATVHALDRGIDSGDLIRTAATPVSPDSSVADLVSATVSLGHEIYVETAVRVAAGDPYKPISQSTLGAGRTFYTREWNILHLWRAIRFVRSGRLGQWVQGGRPELGDVQLVDAFRGTDASRDED
jgi:folate-dependent phosphoribosylglycinamide formyltransferase PurN